MPAGLCNPETRDALIVAPVVALYNCRPGGGASFAYFGFPRAKHLRKRNGWLRLYRLRAEQNKPKRLVSHGTADSDFRRDSEACSALRLIQVFLKSSSLYSNQTDFARLTEQKRHFALDCCGSKPDSDDQA